MKKDVNKAELFFIFCLVMGLITDLGSCFVCMQKEMSSTFLSRGNKLGTRHNYITEMLLKQCKTQQNIQLCYFSDQNICEPNEFQCPGGKCVMKIWRCDGENDCDDGFDEQGCRKLHFFLSDCGG